MEESDDDVDEDTEEDKVEMKTNSGNNQTLYEVQDPSAAVNQAAVDYSSLPSTLQGAVNASEDVRGSIKNGMSKGIASIVPQLIKWHRTWVLTTICQMLLRNTPQLNESLKGSQTRRRSKPYRIMKLKPKENRAVTQRFEHVLGKI